MKFPPILSFPVIGCTPFPPLGPIRLDACPMKAVETFFGGMVMFVTVSARYDSNPGFYLSEPVGVRTISAPVMIDLVDFHLPYFRGDRRFDVPIFRFVQTA